MPPSQGQHFKMKGLLVDMITQGKLTTEETEITGNFDKMNLSSQFLLLRDLHKRNLYFRKPGNSGDISAERTYKVGLGYGQEKDTTGHTYIQEHIYRLSIRLIPITPLLFNNFTVPNSSFYRSLFPMDQHSRRVQQHG